MLSYLAQASTPFGSLRRSTKSPLAEISISAQGNSWRIHLKARVGDHLHLPLALGRLDFLLEEGVDAEGADAGHAGVSDRRIRSRIGLGACPVRGVLKQAAHLAECLLFAGDLERQSAQWRAECPRQCQRWRGQVQAL